MSSQAIMSLIITYLGSIFISSFIAWNEFSQISKRHYTITILLVILFVPIVGLPFLWAIGKTREQMKENKKL